MERFGQIDVLVNNAALYAPLHEQKFTEIDVALWDKVMAVNLRGPFLMAKHVAPRMAERKYGKIINIGSGTAVRGIPWMHALRDHQGRHHGDDARDVARARRRRHPRQHADAGLHLSDSIVNENPGHVEPRATAPSRRARSSATSSRRICSAR